MHCLRSHSPNDRNDLRIQAEEPLTESVPLPVSSSPQPKIGWTILGPKSVNFLFSSHLNCHSPCHYIHCYIGSDGQVSINLRLTFAHEGRKSYSIVQMLRLLHICGSNTGTKVGFILVCPKHTFCDSRFQGLTHFMIFFLFFRESADSYPDIAE